MVKIFLLVQSVGSVCWLLRVLKGGVLVISFFSRERMMSSGAALSVLLAVCALFCVFFAASPLPAAAGGSLADAVAFPSEEGAWHTVTVDLGSSVLVRTYGKVLTVETPTDIAVTMGETLSFVNAWIGDSKGDPVSAGAPDRYLVIEGTAANLADANDTTIHEIAYALNGVRYSQFVDSPMRLSAATSQDHDASSGGCETGLGVASLIAAFALIPLRVLRKGKSS